MSLVDLIEQHIKAMLEQSRENFILLRRNELANYFGCAPSQINYVIQTRFSTERGYVTESQRGGGGFIRVIRLELDRVNKFVPALASLETATARQTMDFIHRLKDQKLITTREARIMAAAVERSAAEVPLPLRDRIRAKLLIAMVEAILGERE